MRATCSQPSSSRTPFTRATGQCWAAPRLGEVAPPWDLPHEVQGHDTMLCGRMARGPRPALGELVHQAPTVHPSPYPDDKLVTRPHSSRHHSQDGAFPEGCTTDSALRRLWAGSRGFLLSTGNHGRHGGLQASSLIVGIMGTMAPWGHGRHGEVGIMGSSLGILGGYGHHRDHGHQGPGRWEMSPALGGGLILG